jgi:hypothetical protein
MSSPLTIEGNAVATETLTLTANPTPKQVIEIMAKTARFLQRTAVEILSEKDGKMAMVSAANPAANALLQSAATLETGAMQFDALCKQQAGMIAPGQGLRRAN